MLTATASLISALVAGLVVFALTRHYMRVDDNAQRLRQIEAAASQVTRIHDRLGVIEVAVQATGERVNAIEHELVGLVSELRSQGIRVNHFWKQW